MILEMRKDIQSYSREMQQYITEEWVKLIYDGIAKFKVVNWKLIPYLQYEDGTIVE